MSNSIELRQISKGFPGREKPVLDHISLAISQGERLVIEGVSGSGKTTLLNLMALLLKVDEGVIEIQGESVEKWSETRKAKWRNQNVGFVFQKFCLIPELTLLENVAIPARIKGGRFDKHLAVDLLGKVGMKGREGDYPHQLSGGEEQRIAIARALANRPLMLFADEPTGNLDRQTGEQICRLLLEMHNEYGFSLIVASHNRQLADRLGAKNLWMESGKLHRIDHEEDLLWREKGD